MRTKHTRRPGRTAVELALVALFSAISVVLNVFDIPLVGGTQKLTLSYLAPFFAGALLGPIDGFLVGALGDGIGLLINPQGAWLPTITLAAGLIGVLSGLIFRIPKLPVLLKSVLSFAAILLVCTVGINTTTIWLAYGIKAKYFSYVLTRLPFQALCALINCAVAVLLYPLLRLSFDRIFRNFPQKRTPSPHSSPATEGAGTPDRASLPLPGAPLRQRPDNAVHCPAAPSTPEETHSPSVAPGDTPERS